MNKLLNPSVQLLLSFSLSLFVLFTHSWQFNLAITGYAFLSMLIFRQQAWRRIVQLLVGLFLITGVYFSTTYLHPNQSILVSATDNSPLLLSLELGSRILALGMIGISLSTSIEKNHFIASLIKQLKVPVPIAYSILVAINFLGLITSEYQQAKLALRLRGFSGLSVHFKALLTMIIRLMRQSEYTARAMEARGFSPSRLQKIPASITKLDIAYVLLTGLYVLGILWL